MESMTTSDLDDFTSVLSSKAPVPGGGGASALVGAVGASLATMVGNLTVGKKKYAEVEDEVYGLMGKAERVRTDLLALIDADAAAFEPLSKAYGIPKDDPSRPEIMEKALVAACTPPMDIMRTIARAVDVLARMAEIGSRIALSDVGVGAVFCKAAIQGASLNVFINTKSMTDRAYAESLEKEADAIIEKYCAMADDIYASVTTTLRG